jgi:serine/threonine protein phosphatase 1
MTDHPALPEGQLIYAVGDVHGRSDLLATLLRQIERDAQESGKGASRRALIFLGDYVDRGPDSKGVIDLLLHSLPSGFDAHFLKGNHEALLIDFLDDGRGLEQWLANGATATFASYGVDVEALLRTRADPDAWRRALLVGMLESHRRFFEHLELAVSYGDYLFVHAGIRPGVPLEAQDARDLIWIRGEFLRSDADFGKVVVHGHTPKPEPEIRPNRIGIDTGAVFSNRLTAVRLDGGTVRILQAVSGDA